LESSLPNDLLNSLATIKDFNRTAFEGVHEQPQAITSIRFNIDKYERYTSLKNIIHPQYNLNDPVPWCSYGFYLHERPQFTLDPLLHAGAYYVQEASSMFLWNVLQQTFDQHAEIKMLDLCAAPGGKTTLLASYFKNALIVSNEVIKIINVPVMSTSEMNGIAGCIYNVTIPNIDNWRRYAQGSRFGAESLAEIYSDPIIAKKVVFNLMDGLVAQYAGGPQSQPNYAVHHATLYASKDPVALDAVALRRLEQWRTGASLPPIGPAAAYVGFASQLGLGNSAPNRIEVRNIGR